MNKRSVTMIQQEITILRYQQKVNTIIIQRRKPLHSALSLLFMICIICIGSYGCTTGGPVRDYPKTPASTFSRAKTMADLCIAAHALTNKDDLNLYFGADLS